MYYDDLYSRGFMTGCICLFALPMGSVYVVSDNWEAVSFAVLTMCVVLEPMQQSTRSLPFCWLFTNIYIYIYTLVSNVVLLH